MSIHLIKALKRSLLGVILAAIVVALQIQTNAQVVQPSIAVQSTQTQLAQNAVVAVESVGMTVADMEQAIKFYSTVLSFKEVSDVEVLGTEYEQLQELFGGRLRVVRMQLGEELSS